MTDDATPIRPISGPVKGGGYPDEELKAMQEVLDGLRFIDAALNEMLDDDDARSRVKRWAQEKAQAEVPELFEGWVPE